MDTLITKIPEVFNKLCHRGNLVDKVHNYSASFFHFTTLDNFLKIWATQKLLFSSRKCMNDSAEQEDIASGVRNYADFMAHWYAIDEYKQLSLSWSDTEAMYLSPTMWGLYAKNAKGVCIELDSTKLNLDDNIYKCSMIEYTPYIPNCPRLPYGEPYHSIKDAVDFVDQHIHEIYFRKHHEWDFEREYRVISKKKSFLDISGAISCVYIFNMTDSDYAVVDGLNSQLPEDKRLKFKAVQYRSCADTSKELKVYDAVDEYNRQRIAKNIYIKQGEEDFERMQKEYKMSLN